MSPKQKVLFTQLQIAGAGLVIVIMAWILDAPVFYIVGGFVILLGLVRLILLNHLLGKEEDENVSESDTIDKGDPKNNPKNSPDLEADLDVRSYQGGSLRSMLSEFRSENSGRNSDDSSSSQD